jgi:hypothetical protein
MLKSQIYFLRHLEFAIPLDLIHPRFITSCEL